VGVHIHRSICCSSAGGSLAEIKLGIIVDVGTGGIGISNRWTTNSISPHIPQQQNPSPHPIHLTAASLTNPFSLSPHIRFNGQRAFHQHTGGPQSPVLFAQSTLSHTFTVAHVIPLFIQKDIDECQCIMHQVRREEL